MHKRQEGRDESEACCDLTSGVEFGVGGYRVIGLRSAEYLLTSVYVRQCYLGLGHDFALALTAHNNGANSHLSRDIAVAMLHYNVFDVASLLELGNGWSTG